MGRLGVYIRGYTNDFGEIDAMEEYNYRGYCGCLRI
jgi:hypothetical protein